MITLGQGFFDHIDFIDIIRLLLLLLDVTLSDQIVRTLLFIANFVILLSHENNTFTIFGNFYLGIWHGGAQGRAKSPVNACRTARALN